MRYVDHDLVPYELFIGLYALSWTTRKEIAQVAVDVLLRLNLPMSGCVVRHMMELPICQASTGAQAVLKR